MQNKATLEFLLAPVRNAVIKNTVTWPWWCKPVIPAVGESEARSFKLLSRALSLNQAQDKAGDVLTDQMPLSSIAVNSFSRIRKQCNSYKILRGCGRK